MKEEKKQDNAAEIDIVEMLSFFLQRWYAFLLAAVVAAVLGLSYCYFFITPQYQSTTEIYILPKNGGGEVTTSTITLSSQLAKDYESLIRTRYVLEKVIAECDLDMSYEALKSKISVENKTETRIITITVENPSPELAQKIAITVEEVAAEHIKSVTDVEAVNVADPANFPTTTSSPSYARWGVISAAVGFLLVLVVLVIRFLMDDTIKTEDEIEKYLDISVLAVIPLEVKPQEAQKKKKK